MSWSFKVVRIAGTDIRIHGTFLLILAWYAVIDYEAGGIERMLFGSFFILLLFTCVVLHELGHATAARRYGIRTPDITLLPIGGVARLEKLPDKPSQEIVVALAGPTVNVIIAIILFLGMERSWSASDFFSFEIAKGTLISKLFIANVMLVLFNLIPAFPMDGGRVLRAALACYVNQTQATVIAARIGQGIAILFGILGLVGSNVILPLIAIFIFLAARHEIQYAVIKQITNNLHVGQVMTAQFLALPFDLSVVAAAQEISKHPLEQYPLVDTQLHPRGMVSRQKILKAVETTPLQVILEISLPVPVVRTETPFWEALELMQSHQTAVLPVINPRGQIVGLVNFMQLSKLATDVSESVTSKNDKNP